MCCVAGELAVGLIMDNGLGCNIVGLSFGGFHFRHCFGLNHTQMWQFQFGCTDVGEPQK